MLKGKRERELRSRLLGEQPCCTTIPTLWDMKFAGKSFTFQSISRPYRVSTARSAAMSEIHPRRFKRSSLVLRFLPSCIVRRPRPPLATTAMADRPAISRTQSEELDEAASSLLHLSLEIHLPPPTTVASASSRSPSSHHPQSNTELRNKRRRSLEDLRIPPGYSTITASSRAAKQEDAASTRSANSGDLSSTHDDGGVAGGSSTIPRSPRDDSSGGTGPRGKGRGRTSETHPFAGSPHLLRRASSFETELIREPEEAEDSEEGFTSDVSRLTARKAVDESLTLRSQEEPFRVRPPSIASSSTSQRSSVRCFSTNSKSKLTTTASAAVRRSTRRPIRVRDGCVRTRRELKKVQ